MATMSTRGRIRKDQPPFDYSRTENQEFSETREDRSNISSGAEEPNSEVSSFAKNPFSSIIGILHM